MIRCIHCSRPLVRAAAVNSDGNPVGPVCAAHLGLLPVPVPVAKVLKARLHPSVRLSRAVVADPRQVDWVAAA